MAGNPSIKLGKKGEANAMHQSRDPGKGRSRHAVDVDKERGAVQV